MNPASKFCQGRLDAHDVTRAFQSSNDSDLHRNHDREQMLSENNKLKTSSSDGALNGRILHRMGI